MATNSGNLFLEMIQCLRGQEEVMLYQKILHASPQEDQAVVRYLEAEYSLEQINYPANSPAFDAAAALWAAKTIYIAAQLILYREDKESELVLLLPDYTLTKDAAAIMSADLSLRFLPPMIQTLKMMDSEDVLISVLETKLQQWHYSSVQTNDTIEGLDFTVIQDNECLHQLYCDRIIEYKNLALAQHAVFEAMIHANVGIHSATLWPDFNRLTPSTIHE